MEMNKTQFIEAPGTELDLGDTPPVEEIVEEQAPAGKELETEEKEEPQTPTDDAEETTDDDTEEEVEEEEKEATESTPSKVFKKGDKEFALPEDAVLDVKVNGKHQEVTLSELTRNYQGKIPWETHYRTLKEDRVKFDEEVQGLNSTFQEAVELSYKDPFKALEKLIIKAGKDPKEYWDTYIKQAEATITHLSGLSAAEKRALFAQKAAEVKEQSLKAKEEAFTKQTSKQQRELELASYIGQKHSENNISQDEWDHAFGVFNAAVETKQVDITDWDEKQMADSVCTFITSYLRPTTRLRSVVSGVDKTLASNDTFIGELMKLTDSKMSDADIKEIVQAYVGNDKVEVDSKRALSTEGKKPSTGKIPPKMGKTETKTENEKVILSMEDLLDEYR